jgi:hypothetical protein
LIPTSYVALLIVILVVLPGAIYTWAFERQASGFGVTLADRSLRLVATSLLFHFFAGWPEYWLYRTAFSGRAFGLEQFAAAWTGVTLMIAIPGIIGTAIGSIYSTRHTRDGWRLIRRHLNEETEIKILKFLLGRAPAPRAWDHLFTSRPSGYIRVWTTEQKWVAGLYADRSHAAGAPYETDLYLEEAWEIDERGILSGDKGLGYSVYVPASKIAWLEVLLPVEIDTEGSTRS